MLNKLNAGYVAKGRDYPEGCRHNNSIVFIFGGEIGRGRMMKEIPLTQGFVALVDDDDYEILSAYKWCVAISNGRPQAVRRENRKTIYMHRQIMGVGPDDLLVDHRDLNPLNNQKENLRLASRGQNSMNRGRLSHGDQSLPKGVSFHKKSKKWTAFIQKDLKRSCLGMFTSPEAAGEAYKQAARELHGEFARV